MTQDTMPQCAIEFDNKVYRVQADTKLVLAIEDELGAITSLHHALENGTWSFSALLTAAHIMLGHAGRDVDYMTLGRYMMAGRIRRYHTVVTRFINHILA